MEKGQVIIRIYSNFKIKSYGVAKIYSCHKFAIYYANKPYNCKLFGLCVFHEFLKVSEKLTFYRLTYSLI